MANMRLLDPNFVYSSLNRIAPERSRIFGGNSHGFRLNPCLKDSELQKFEQSHAIKLPVEYSHFLTKIGDGGAGPYYGIFPVGMMDGTVSELRPWQENDGFIGNLSSQFLLKNSWNDLTLQPADELSKLDEKEYDRQIEEFDKIYLDAKRMDGAIPICHLGCAKRIWLIVSGEQAGFLWHDDRAEFKGLSPVLLHDGSRASFSSWYLEWLESPLSLPLDTQSIPPH